MSESPTQVTWKITQRYRGWAPLNLEDELIRTFRRRWQAVFYKWLWYSGYEPTIQASFEWIICEVTPKTRGNQMTTPTDDSAKQWGICSECQAKIDKGESVMVYETYHPQCEHSRSMSTTPTPDAALVERLRNNPHNWEACDLAAEAIERLTKQNEFWQGEIDGTLERGDKVLVERNELRAEVERLTLRWTDAPTEPGWWLSRSRKDRTQFCKHWNQSQVEAWKGLASDYEWAGPLPEPEAAK